MTLRTRTPTGKPAWPIILIAGREKSGKSWAAAEATKSPLIGATYWIAIGEDDPDELGRVGDFDIVEHDGSLADILSAIRDIILLDDPDRPPTLIVLDSISMVWAMLSEEAQCLANERAARKAAKYGRKAPSDDVTIAVDLWGRAAKRWRQLMDLLRAHRGPVIVTARLEQVVIVDAAGEPTKEREWKIHGHKSLPYDASCIVQLRSRRERYVTGVRSAVWATDQDALIELPPSAGVRELWERLGLDESDDRTHRVPDGAASLAADDAIREDLLRRLAAVTSDQESMERWWRNNHGGEELAEASDLLALIQLVEQGESRAKAAAEKNPGEGGGDV